MLTPEIPVFFDIALSPRQRIEEQRIPIVYSGSSLLTIFFKSLYYFGTEQITLHRNAPPYDFDVYAHREFTPFLKSKWGYATWISLKILFHASLVWNWRVGIPLEVVGLLFELRKWLTTVRAFRFSSFALPPPKLEFNSSGAPPIYKDYLHCPKKADSQRAFFKELTPVQSQDLCRTFARLPSEKVAELLEFDLNNVIFDDCFYKELLDTLVLQSEDPFLCFYPLIHKYSGIAFDEVPTKKHQLYCFAKMRETLKMSLSISSPAEKISQTEPEKSFIFIDNYAMALKLVSRYLANNDRANVARCSKLFRKAFLDRLHVPAVQTHIGKKLICCVDQNILIDRFSRGQIICLLKSAYQLGFHHLQTIGLRLFAPSQDIEVWKEASALYLSLDRTPLKPVPLFVHAYQIYLNWQKGQIPEQAKEKIFIQFFNFILVSQQHGHPCDPLAIFILESGTEKDKKLVVRIYLEMFEKHPHNRFEARVSFLLLLQRYLLQSPEAFKTHFLAHFQEPMRKYPSEISKDKARSHWRQSTQTSLSFDTFIDEEISLHLHRKAPLYNSIISKLESLEPNKATATLLRDCFASLIYR